VIAKVPLFEGLPKRAQRDLAALAKVTDHDEGTEIISEGAAGVALYVILEGRAEVLVRRKTIATLRVGDSFGELAIIDGQPRTATVRAVTPMRTLVLSRWSAKPVLEDPAVMRRLLVTVTKWLRDAQGNPID
jgi:CRP/FNR family cyclic AMP-dependent transcriptional regulator